MTRDLQSLIERWDGVGIVSRFDAVSGTWMFICLHDNTLGSCTGGTRMKVYDSPAAGLRDAWLASSPVIAMNNKRRAV